MLNIYKRWLEKKHKEWEEEYLKTMPITTSTIKYIPHELQHYEMTKRIHREDVDKFGEDVILNGVKRDVLNQLHDIVKTHIEVEKDPIHMDYLYHFDLWFKR